MTQPADVASWYAVRCIFVDAESRRDRQPDEADYEERITLWRADTAEAAIALAEQEAEEYADLVACEYTGLAQSFFCFDEPGHGMELFSLIRRSTLDTEDYLDHFFDTGAEHERIVSPPPTADDVE